MMPPSTEFIPILSQKGKKSSMVFRIYNREPDTKGGYTQWRTGQ